MYQLEGTSGISILTDQKVAFLKSEVAQILGVHHNTVTTWDTLAFFRIPHYRKCYEISPGNYNRRMPLASYQVWVLKRIQQLLSQLRNADRVRQYLSAYPHEFTYQAFQQEPKLS